MNCFYHPTPSIQRRCLTLLSLLLPGWLTTSALTSAAADPDARAMAREIDSLVAQKLAQHQIQPHAPASDEVFLRRVTLDIAGRIPTLKETHAFLNNADADKRSRLIDQLLDSDGYVQHHFNFWADVLRMKSAMERNQSLPAGLAYADWLKKSLAANKPFDAMVRELVTAEGKTYDNGAVGYYIRDFNMPLDNMAVTTQVFLGTQMVCAQCHDHPFDKWSMMDYYQMAAHTYGVTGANNLVGRALYGGAYSKTTKKGQGTNAGGTTPKEKLILGKAMTEILRPLRYNTVVHYQRALALPHDYAYADAKPGDLIEPAIPVSFSPEGTSVGQSKSPVVAYADWMTAQKNPRFALVAANRLWKKVMGQGVIEPVDELTDSTVPSNPALMTYLEKLMKASHFDMKAYLRVLYNTDTYQRASYTQELALGEAYHFPGPLMRRMTAEQIWDSLIALYKAQPDRPSREAELERLNLLTRVRWLDQALAALSDEELLAGARRVAKVQEEEAAKVRQAQEILDAAEETGDEDAIRAAKRTVSRQRDRINQAVRNFVYEVGYQKLVALAKIGQLEAQGHPDLAREIQQVLQTETGDQLHFNQAIVAVQRMRRSGLDEWEASQRDRLMKAFNVSKAETRDFDRYATNCEQIMLRAADLRSPAPHGHFLREFGQSDRELIDNANPDATVGQALIMLNGEHFEDLLNPFTVLARALARAKTADQAVDTLFLALLSRNATAEEKHWLGPVISSANGEGMTYALWALLNTKQFLFIQ
jgi:uncharacterized protein YqcC (DUF446 family)